MNRLIGGAVLMAMVTGAHAQDEGAAADGAFRPGWYVAPMAAYMRPDSARCAGSEPCAVDDGFGAVAAIGHRGDFANLELWLQYVALSYERSYQRPAPTQLDPDAMETVNESGDVKLNGAGLGLVVGPFFEHRILARLFGVIGFGVLQRKDHPYYAQDDTTIFGDAGLGYLHPRLFGWDLNLRAEARYRYDVQQPPHPDNLPRAFSDVLVQIGLQIPLSARPEPPAPDPQPVAVVATADVDGDGVSDERDQCPDSAAGVTVDDVGCEPATAPVTLETARAGDTIVLHGVNFESASDTLTVNARRLLGDVARQLDARLALRLEIGGHTDSRGSDHYNQSLSERRAQAVRAHLIGQGVDAGRLSAIGYGETQPVDSNETEDGRERNRRVELRILE